MLWKGKRKIIVVGFGTIYKREISGLYPTAQYLKDVSALPLSEQFLQWKEEDLHDRLNVGKFMTADIWLQCILITQVKVSKRHLWRT